jgi:predicted alpha/beta-fold hydrolase
MSVEPFAPRGLLANAHVQSLLTSGAWRKRHVQGRAQSYLQRSQAKVWRADDGARLLAWHATAPETAPSAGRGLVILLHGWEGSSDSNYLLSCALTLDQAGFDTVRLNLRDHGPSHHLNVELFHSCRLHEVVDVVGQMVKAHAPNPVYLVGFSLGGNFTLRVARAAPSYGYRLQRAIAVSPVIRPAQVLTALEQGPAIYHAYFVRKWRRSLRIKQALFPERYQFDDWFKIRHLRDQTDYLINHFTEYDSLSSYLNGYAVADDYLADLDIDTLIITAEDDSIIPIGDFDDLAPSPALTVERVQRGGHCGFISNWRMDCWVEHRIVNALGVQP